MTHEDRPAPRAARRAKTIDVRLDGDLLRFEGRLVDSYGEPDGVTIIHELTATGSIATPRLEIAEIRVEAPTVPFRTCRLTLARVDQVVGLRIASGFGREVQRRLGGAAGCSHVTTLVLELADAGVLHWFIRIRDYLPYSVDNRESGRWGAVGLALNPELVDVCHGWAEGGTTLARAKHVLNDPSLTSIPTLDLPPRRTPMDDSDVDR
jgi:hypothetical protein